MISIVNSKRKYEMITNGLFNKTNNSFSCKKKEEKGHILPNPTDVNHPLPRPILNTSNDVNVDKIHVAQNVLRWKTRLDPHRHQCLQKEIR